MRAVCEPLTPSLTTGDHDFYSKEVSPTMVAAGEYVGGRSAGWAPQSSFSHTFGGSCVHILQAPFTSRSAPAAASFLEIQWDPEPSSATH